MSRLRDAFDALIGERPPGDPDAILAAARAEAAAPPTSRRWAATGLVAAAVVLLAVIATALVVTRDDGTDDVRTGPTTTATTTTTSLPEEVDVAIHLRNGTGAGCTLTQGVPRTVPGDDPIRRAFEELVSDGPTLEEGRLGLSSWFWQETDGSVRSVRVEDGVAHVDFDDLRPYFTNVSTACGSASLLAQLDHTASQFPEVERTVYSLEGDVTAFYTWLGIEPPEGFAEQRAPGFVTPVTAVASDAGVTVTDAEGTATPITAQAANVAFVAADHVVFQGDDPADTTHPIGVGPIRVWHDGTTRTLDTDQDATSATLLDAALVEGRPMALVSERTDGAPDTSWDVLVATDLSTGGRRTIARLGAWESETVQAALLPDGSVVRLGVAEGHTTLSRWREGDADFVWGKEVQASSAPTLAVSENGATVISIAPIDGGRQTLHLTRFDLETGGGDPTDAVELDGSNPDPVWCQDWLAEGELSCSRTSADPIGVLLDGRVRPLPTEPGARITVGG